MTDIQLITLAKSGHSQAVAQLYDKYVEPIYRYCYWQTNNNSEDAEDLTQDVFIEMARSIKNFKGRGSFKNWLYTIAKRQVTKWIRRKYQAKLIPLFENIVEQEQKIDPINQLRKIKKINQIMNTLKPRAQKILRLRYLRNFSVSETAKALGISESNVKVITHRALKQLQTSAM